jgi:hypothetical protein
MSAFLRRAAALLTVCTVASIGLVLGAGAAVAEPPPPARCFRANEYGVPPTCTWDGTRWTRSYPGDGTDGLPGTGPGGEFAALFVLAVLAGVAFTVWKVSTSRRMAREAGMSTRDATAMALLTDDGFEATYLASNLRARPGPAPTSAPTTTVAERLRELADLRDQGLITTEEHDTRRASVLDSL